MRNRESVTGMDICTPFKDASCIAKKTVIIYGDFKLTDPDEWFKASNEWLETVGIHQEITMT